jgi:hypothetical protein
LKGDQLRRPQVPDKGVCIVHFISPLGGDKFSQGIVFALTRFQLLICNVLCIYFFNFPAKNLLFKFFSIAAPGLGIEPVLSDCIDRRIKLTLVCKLQKE